MAWHRLLRGKNSVVSSHFCFPCSSTVRGRHLSKLPNTLVRQISPAVHRNILPASFCRPKTDLSTLDIRNCVWSLRCLSTKESELNWFDIDTPEFVDLVADHKEGRRSDVILIDVREPEELIEDGKVPGTINIPLGTVEEALGLDADAFMERYATNKPTQDNTDIVFHCKRGVRSLVAIEMANKLGYSRARHYVRGYCGWEDHLETTKQ